MSASLAPECNEVKEYVQRDLDSAGDTDADGQTGVMTVAFSNGTARVRKLPKVLPDLHGD